MRVAVLFAVVGAVTAEGNATRKRRWVTLDDTTESMKVIGYTAENSLATNNNPVLCGGRFDTSDRTIDSGKTGAFAVDRAGRLKVSLAQTSIGTNINHQSESVEIFGQDLDGDNRELLLWRNGRLAPIDPSFVDAWSSTPTAVHHDNPTVLRFKGGGTASATATLAGMGTEHVTTQFETAAAVFLSSDNIADDSGSTGAEKVTLYGLDSNADYVEVEVTMDGTTEVSSVTTFLDLWGMRVTDSGSWLASNVGTVSAMTTGKASTYLEMAPGAGEAFVAHGMIPRNHQGAIRRIFTSAGGTTDKCTHTLYTVTATDSGTYVNAHETYYTVTAGGTTTYEPLTYKILPAHSRFWVESSCTDITDAYQVYVDVMYADTDGVDPSTTTTTQTTTTTTVTGG